MGLVTRPIQSLYNGVSQQPATIRLDSQCEEQVNAWGTVVEGVRKRPPSLYVNRITTAPVSGAHLHKINRDADEKYDVIVTATTIRVFDEAGVERTVAFPAGTSYLSLPAGATAESSFALETVADFTFVVNKTKTVAMAPLDADLSPQNANYWWLNRPQSSGATGAQQLQYPPNTPITSFMGTVQSFDDLPQSATVGSLYQIVGTQDSNFATYYVVRGAGVWNECRAPGLVNMIDNLTMPHALVRLGDGTFAFAPFSWAPRRVGDYTSNPNPTFVGRQISDVFFWRNRLCLTVNETTAMSRVGDFGNFFRLTAVTLLPDETVDIATSETQVTNLRYAIPMGGELMLFSDETQFRINHDANAGVTPTSLSIDAVTHYSTAPAVEPVNLGSDVYFVAEDKGFATVYEYGVTPGSEHLDASSVTGHVPKYIPAGVRKLIPSSTQDALFVLTAGEPNRVYVYKFYWASDTEKAQSSWSYWEFGANDVVLSGSVQDNYLHLLVDRSDGTYLEKIPLAPNDTADGATYQIYLDRRVSVRGVYSATTGRTTFTLPYPVATADQPSFRVVHGPGFTSGPAALVDTAQYVWSNSTTMTVLGDHSAADCFCGLAYTMRYTFSERFLKNAQQVPIITGRFQLRTYTVYYTDSAFFRTEVAPYGVDVEVETIVPAQLSEFSGKTLGDASLLLGSPVFHTGSYQFQIYGDSDTAVVSLTNDSHLASTFQAAEYEGFYHNRATA